MQKGQECFSRHFLWNQAKKQAPQAGDPTLLLILMREKHSKILPLTAVGSSEANPPPKGEEEKSPSKRRA